MHKIEVCDKCKGTNIKTLIPKIKAISSDIDIEIWFIHCCGVGRDKVVVLVDHIPIIGVSEEEVISKIIEKLKRI